MPTPSAGENVEKLGLSHIVDRDVKRCSTLGNCLAIPFKAKNGFTL